VIEPNGKQVLLSSLKGKVVVIEFLFTTCPHCQKQSQLMTKLQKELGPRGFQALGVAFNDGVNPQMVGQFVQEFGVGYPVGNASRDTALSYLGISVMERWAVPQMVVIDRKGIIRSQTEPLPSGSLQDETKLRALVESLLKEGASTGGGAKASSKK
jgi:peroxiredoxin